MLTVDVKQQYNTICRLGDWHARQFCYYHSDLASENLFETLRNWCVPCGFHDNQIYMIKGRKNKTLWPNLRNILKNNTPHATHPSLHNCVARPGVTCLRETSIEIMDRWHAILRPYFTSLSRVFQSYRTMWGWYYERLVTVEQIAAVSGT